MFIHIRSRTGFPKLVCRLYGLNEVKFIKGFKVTVAVKTEQNRELENWLIDFVVRQWNQRQKVRVNLTEMFDICFFIDGIWFFKNVWQI